MIGKTRCLIVGAFPLTLKARKQYLWDWPFTCFLDKVFTQFTGDKESQVQFWMGQDSTTTTIQALQGGGTVGNGMKITRKITRKLDIEEDCGTG